MLFIFLQLPVGISENSQDRRIKMRCAECFDSIVPNPYLCVVRSLCGISATVVEVAYCMVEFLVRLMYIVMSVLVDFTNVFEGSLEKDHDEWRYIMTAVAGFHSICRLLAASLLLYAALKQRVLLLRVWVKITMILYVFLLVDILTLVDECITGPCDVQVLVLRSGIIVTRVVWYLVMMALVTTHWWVLEYGPVKVYIHEQTGRKFHSRSSLLRGVGRAHGAAGTHQTSSYSKHSSKPATCLKSDSSKTRVQFESTTPPKDFDSENHNQTKHSAIKFAEPGNPTNHIDPPIILKPIIKSQPTDAPSMKRIDNRNQTDSATVSSDRPISVSVSSSKQLDALDTKQPAVQSKLPQQQSYETKRQMTPVRQYNSERPNPYEVEETSRTTTPGLSKPSSAPSQTKDGSRNISPQAHVTGRTTQHADSSGQNEPLPVKKEGARVDVSNDESGKKGNGTGASVGGVDQSNRATTDGSHGAHGGTSSGSKPEKTRERSGSPRSP